MLDDSLTAGRLEPVRRPESPTVTIDDPSLAGDLGADEDRKQLTVGDRFAGFVIRAILGRGAMGVVYEAWDPTHERRVTLKLLRSPTRRASPGTRSRSRRGARRARP